MTNGALPDPILPGVSRLPVLVPNEQRAARLRARCHARLARRAPEKTRGFGPAAVAGFCLLYLSAVVHDVLRVRDMF
jgi:hypothetical protein